MAAASEVLWAGSFMAAGGGPEPTGVSSSDTVMTRGGTIISFGSSAPSETKEYPAVRTAATVLITVTSFIIRL